MVEAIHESISKLEFRIKLAEFIQILFSGLSLGSILILMAMWLAIIYGLVGVINMAHGEFMMIGAYTTFLVQCYFMKYVSAESVDHFFLISLPISFLVAGSFGDRGSALVATASQNVTADPVSRSSLAVCFLFLAIATAFLWSSFELGEKARLVPMVVVAVTLLLFVARICVEAYVLFHRTGTRERVALNQQLDSNIAAEGLEAALKEPMPKLFGDALLFLAAPLSLYVLGPLLGGTIYLFTFFSMRMDWPWQTRLMVTAGLAIFAAALYGFTQLISQ